MVPNGLDIPARPRRLSPARKAFSAARIDESELTTYVGGTIKLVVLPPLTEACSSWALGRQARYSYRPQRSKMAAPGILTLCNNYPRACGAGIVR